MLFVKKETPKNESRVILFSFLSSRGTQSSVSSQIGFHVNSQKTKSHYANSATELFKWKEKTRKVYNWICTQNGQWNFLFTTCCRYCLHCIVYIQPILTPKASSVSVWSDATSVTETVQTNQNKETWHQQQPRLWHTGDYWMVRFFSCHSDSWL